MITIYNSTLVLNNTHTTALEQYYTLTCCNNITIPNTIVLNNTMVQQYYNTNSIHATVNSIHTAVVKHVITAVDSERSSCIEPISQH